MKSSAHTSSHSSGMLTQLFSGLAIGSAVIAVILGLPTLAAELAGGRVVNANHVGNPLDNRVQVKLQSPAQQNTSSTMTLTQYEIEVLSAELSPNTPQAAVEAAAIATRTMVIRALMPLGGGQSNTGHGPWVAQLEDNDLPLWTRHQVENAYGEQSSLFLAQIKAAIETTDGQILTYRGQPILSFQTPVTTGATVPASQVLGRSIPYLVRVNCPSDASYPVQNRRISIAGSTWRQVFPSEQPPSDIASWNDWIRVVDRAPSGDVLEVMVGNKRLTGSQFAANLGIPSWNYDILGGSIRQPLQIEVNGTGTGMGMSLHQAAVWAASGMTDTQILSRFYPGSHLQLDSTWLS
ncbi:SpoIID/LytB domain-containing protein [Alicyclobacillus tolerans]|uniref:SpoIID/LytB domain-containing protein n=1 Tax=Alicyclobacillus tolerans TaxID=90970 RepID=UPI003B782DD1